MRDGTGSEFLFILRSPTIIGLRFGVDFVSEHERGIGDLEKAFGVSPYRGTAHAIGMKRRQIQTVPEGLRWMEGLSGGKRPASGFFFSPYDTAAPHYVPSFRFRGESTLWTAWCDREFGAFSTNLGEIAHLHCLYRALVAKDAAMWVGGGDLVKNGSFVLAIASRIPHTIVLQWEEADKKEIKLRKDFAATGIEGKLRKANRAYFSLKPKRGEDGELTFWLNPIQQEKYQAGWYTLEDLEHWAEDRGKVLKKRGK